MSLLEVEDLRVSFPTADGLVQAVRGVSFSLESGQTLGIVGESGSGKSVCTQTLLGLTPGADISGLALFCGRDLLTMSEEELREIRGAEIAMIFQDPLSSLHPHYRVGWQIVEMIRAHSDESRHLARTRAIELLGMVGIPQPDRRVDSYPHELSGGMRQRVMIAMALALHPKVLIADEPTTALDATVQAQIVELMGSLQRELGMALIMITHDLGVVARIADEVLVMYAGKPVEIADRRTTYYQPHHPYTRGLLHSIPATAAAGDRLRPIVGHPPSLIHVPTGCAFHPRCPFVMDVCTTDEPPLQAVLGATPHRSACWLPTSLVGISEEIDTARQRAASAHRTAGALRVVARQEVLTASVGDPPMDHVPDG